MAQWVKDLVVSPPPWLRLQLWRRFDPRPRNFCMLHAQPKKQKNKNKTSRSISIRSLGVSGPDLPSVCSI